MFGLVVIEDMNLSGHPWIINETRDIDFFYYCLFELLLVAHKSFLIMGFQSVKMKLVSKDHNPFCHIFAFNVDAVNHRRRKCEGSFPNVSRSIS